MIISLERLLVIVRLGGRELVGREGKRCFSTLYWKSKHGSTLNLCISLGWLYGSGYPEIRSRYEHLPLEPFSGEKLIIEGVQEKKILPDNLYSKQEKKPRSCVKRYLLHLHADPEQ